VLQGRLTEQAQAGQRLTYAGAAAQSFRPSQPLQPVSPSVLAGAFASVPERFAPAASPDEVLARARRAAARDMAVREAAAPQPATVPHAATGRREPVHPADSSSVASSTEITAALGLPVYRPRGLAASTE